MHLRSCECGGWCGAGVTMPNGGGGSDGGDGSDGSDGGGPNGGTAKAPHMFCFANLQLLLRCGTPLTVRRTLARSLRIESYSYSHFLYAIMH